MMQRKEKMKTIQAKVFINNNLTTKRANIRDKDSKGIIKELFQLNIILMP
jgi:hypothetical protein